MGKRLLAAAAGCLLMAACAAPGQQTRPYGLRIGNAGYGGSESLLDRHTTGAEFSGGTLAGAHPGFGSILGSDGIVVPFGDNRGDPTRRLLAPGTSGAGGSGGAPSPTRGAGGR